jgi:N-methylhydantoinase A
VHGTTVTTNATLTATGACGLLTTEGVRDALEMRRGIREEQYNNRYDQREAAGAALPAPPASSGRLDRTGRELAPLDLDAGARPWPSGAAKACGGGGLLHELLRQPGARAGRGRDRAPRDARAYLSVSTEVLPSIRFYERVSTTALNAYVGPKLNHYLDQLVGRLPASAFGACC